MLRFWERMGWRVVGAVSVPSMIWLVNEIHTAAEERAVLKADVEHTEKELDRLRDTLGRMIVPPR